MAPIDKDKEKRLQNYLDKKHHMEEEVYITIPKITDLFYFRRAVLKTKMKRKQPKGNR